MTTFGPQVDWPLEGHIRYPAKMIDEFQWDIEMPDGTGHDGEPNRRWIWKEPMGVVGAIVPWNYPVEVTLGKIAQALATGNTVVLKPAPDTPWNATLLGRVVAERTDIPAGVFNVVTSSDHLVGEELTVSPQVDLISFTGSTATGKRIMEKGAATLKQCFSSSEANPPPSFSMTPTLRRHSSEAWGSAITQDKRAPFRRDCSCPEIGMTNQLRRLSPISPWFLMVIRRAPTS